MIFVIWTLFIIADAYWNAVKIKKGLHVFHGLESIYRTALFAGLYIGSAIYKLNVLKNISFVLACFFSGWLIFNIALNAFRKLPITYLGEDSILDRLEALSPSRIAIMWTKLILALGAITAFYYGTLNPMG